MEGGMDDLDLHCCIRLAGSASSVAPSNTGGDAAGVPVWLADVGTFSVMSLHSIAEAGAWSWVYKLTQDTLLGRSCGK